MPSHFFWSVGSVKFALCLAARHLSRECYMPLIQRIAASVGIAGVGVVEVGFAVVDAGGSGGGSTGGDLGASHLGGILVLESRDRER